MRVNHNYNDFQLVINSMEKKLQLPKEKWRRILKTLFVVEHLIRLGNNRFMDSLHSFSWMIKNLQTFRYEDENRNDKGGSSKLFFT